MVWLSGSLPDGTYCLALVLEGEFTVGATYSGTAVERVEVIVQDNTLPPTVLWDSAATGEYDALVLDGECAAASRIVTGDALDDTAGLRVAIPVNAQFPVLLLVCAVLLVICRRSARE